MTNPIHFNYIEAGHSTDRVSTIVNNMKTNIEEIKRLRDKLLQEFEGAGAKDYQWLTDGLNTRLGNYEASLNKLNGKIIQTSTKGGDMDVVDGQIAGGFRSV
ncbi:hypothetical protein [Nocardia sp. NBC_01009]|uniref:hypothetical protein n=1 Tax=Nocardia sp. NBC_01009 TaxID=2975996 RepID=UPI00386410A8|nr:hypothetical protein OHA42_32595 [Nocardia sp. NBC_01009]